MSKNIRETIKDDLLAKIKKSSTEKERYEAIFNFSAFVGALQIEDETGYNKE